MLTCAIGSCPSIDPYNQCGRLDRFRALMSHVLPGDIPIFERRHSASWIYHQWSSWPSYQKKTLFGISWSAHWGVPLWHLATRQCDKPSTTCQLGQNSQDWQWSNQHRYGDMTQNVSHGHVTISLSELHPKEVRKFFVRMGKWSLDGSWMEHATGWSKRNTAAVSKTISLVVTNSTIQLTIIIWTIHRLKLCHQPYQWLLSTVISQNQSKPIITTCSFGHGQEL